MTLIIVGFKQHCISSRYSEKGYLITPYLIKLRGCCLLGAESTLFNVTIRGARGIGCLGWTRAQRGPWDRLPWLDSGFFLFSSSFFLVTPIRPADVAAMQLAYRNDGR